MAPAAELEEEQCTVISGPFAIAVQAFLAFVVLATLVYKRSTEHPQRKLNVWLMDVSKQGFAMSLQHFVNVALAVIFAREKGLAGECVWYIANFCITVVCGLIVLTAYMRIHHVFVDTYKLTWLQSGEYGDPPDLRIWLAQTCYWGFVCCMEKFVVAGTVIFPLHNRIDAAIAPLEEPWKRNPKMELVFVMVIAPTLLNPIWSWIIDNLVKDRKLGKEEDTKGYGAVEDEVRNTY
mmetsp:Transcript_96145/g.229007  ORF Transcript_96145/g.229007 Transcript_96145/m.229007 type:complete len:235 (+) Transcript_96145:101-805(+)